jgi:hypothetical protein
MENKNNLDVNIRTHVVKAFGDLRIMSLMKTYPLFEDIPESFILAYTIDRISKDPEAFFRKFRDEDVPFSEGMFYPMNVTPEPEDLDDQSDLEDIASTLFHDLRRTPEFIRLAKEDTGY